MTPEELFELIPELANMPIKDNMKLLLKHLPKQARIGDKRWDIIDWLLRPGNAEKFNIIYEEFDDSKLMCLCQIFTLSRRSIKNVSRSAATMYKTAFNAIDEVLVGTHFTKITSIHFQAVEKLFRTKYSRTTPFRLAALLQKIADWFTHELNIPILYSSSMGSLYLHGRRGPEAGRRKKLLNDEILEQLLGKNSRTDLCLKDRFFIQVTAILVTGFRIGEEMTLPVECIEEHDGMMWLRYFPEKKAFFSLKPVPDDYRQVAEAAIKTITEMTKDARATASLEANVIDWKRVFNNKEVTEYFVAKFAHSWTADQENRIINPDGAWFQREKRFVDVIGLISEKGSISEAARALGVDRSTICGLRVAQLNARNNKPANKIDGRGKSVRTVWDTDSRVISTLKFFEYTGKITNNRDYVTPIINAAKQMQIEGLVYPQPEYDAEIEREYKFTKRPVIKAENGDPILKAEQSLFVAFHNQFSELKRDGAATYRLITTQDYFRWLTGEKRSRGTGNHEDSVFERLGITDPETGKIVSFTSHDIRHWLDTLYSQGEMPEETIALIFGRDIKSNFHYDQTSITTRIDRMKRIILGDQAQANNHIAKNYLRISKHSPEDADKYLESVFLAVILMPHGICTRSWTLPPCEMLLGCFYNESSKGDPCPYLIISETDEEQRRLLYSMIRSLNYVIPQVQSNELLYERLSVVKQTITNILNRHNIAVNQ